MTALPLIADRVLNRPLLILPSKADIIKGVLGERIGVNVPEASRFFGDNMERDPNGRAIAYKPYKVDQGVAIISIVGTLVNRGAWVGAYSGIVSYEGIQHQITTAVADPKVHTILLDMDTPGGEAVGCAETAAVLAAAGQKKRTCALVAGMAASAGYWIASAAQEIVTTETGVSGSIGVVLIHADYSAMLEQAGVAATLIYAGDHKVDGNPYQPLPESVRADLQAEVDSFYAMFVRGVAKGRGKRLSTEAARATQARTFVGKAAVDAGLADSVGSIHSVLADLIRASGRKSVQNGGKPMDANIIETSLIDVVPKAEHEKAVVDARTEGERVGEERGRKAGAEAERGRISAILATEGVAGNAARMAAAMSLAADAPEMATEKVAAHALAVGTSGKPSASLGNRQQADALGSAALTGGLKPEAANDKVSASDIYAKRRGA